MRSSTAFTCFRFVAIFPVGHFITTPLLNENLEKVPPPANSTIPCNNVQKSNFLLKLGGHLSRCRDTGDVLLFRGTFFFKRAELSASVFRRCPELPVSVFRRCVESWVPFEKYAELRALFWKRSKIVPVVLHNNWQFLPH